MWHFNTVDELRYDHLLGLRREDRPIGHPSASPKQRRHMLSAARRFCRWRDGRDPRRMALGDRESARVERKMLHDLVPMETLPQAHSPIRSSSADRGATKVTEI